MLGAAAVGEEMVRVFGPRAGESSAAAELTKSL